MPSIMSIGEVTISPSGSSSGSPGNDFSLTCSATTINNSPLPSDVPSPTFEWFYGLSGNASLPFGVIAMATASSNGSTYSSTLQFFTLNQGHTHVVLELGD